MFWQACLYNTFFSFQNLSFVFNLIFCIFQYVWLHENFSLATAISQLNKKAKDTNTHPKIVPMGASVNEAGKFSPNKKRIVKALKVFDSAHVLTAEERVRVEKAKDKIKSNKIKNKRKDKLSLQFEPEMGSRLVQNATLGLVDSPFIESLLREGEVAAHGDVIPHMFNFSLDQNSSDTLKELTTTIVSATEVAAHAYERGTSIEHTASQGLLDAISSVGGSAMDFAMMAFVLSIVMVWKPKTNAEKASISVLVFAYLGARGHLSTLLSNSSLLDWFSKPVSDTNSPESFSFDEVGSVVSGVLSSYMCVKTGSAMFDPKELGRVVSTCGRMKMGVSSITTAISIVVGFVHSSIDAWFTGNPFFLKSGVGFIDEFILEAKVIMKLDDEKELHNLQSSYDRVTAAITFGEGISIKIPGNSEMTGLRQHVNNLLNELRKIKKRLVSSNFKFAGCRQEPVGIMLRGPAGAGKSQCMVHLSHAINSLTLNDTDFGLYQESPGSFNYNRMTENIYWDGYRQSMNVVYMDDMGQAREVAGNPDTESMSVIRCINIFENQLHVANMEGKGNTNFRSNFLIANTNLRNFQFDAINTPSAFMRRWDFVIDVIPKKEFSIDPEATPWRRAIDKSKLPIYDESFPGFDESKRHLVGTTMLDPDCCEYLVQAYVPNSHAFVDTGVVWDFQTLTIEIYQRYLLKERWSKVFLEGLSDTLKRFRQYEDSDVESDGASDCDLQYSLSNPRPFNELCNTNPQAHLFIDVCIKRLIVHCLENDRHLTPDELYSMICSKIENCGETITTCNNLDPEALISLCEEEIDVFELEDSPRKAIFQKSDGFLSRLSSLKTEPWVVKIGEIYQFTLVYLQGLASSTSDFVSKSAASLLSLAGSKFFDRAVISKLAKFAAVCAAVKLVCVIVGRLYEKGSPESDVRSGRLRRARVVRPKAVVPQSFKASHSNLWDVMHSLQKSNSFEVFIPNPVKGIGEEKQVRIGYALGLRDRFVLLPYHFLSCLQSETDANLYPLSAKVHLCRLGVPSIVLTVGEVLSSYVEFSEADERDLALIALPQRFNPVRDITHLICSQAKHDGYTAFNSVVLVPSLKNSELHLSTARTGGKIKVESEEFEPYYISHTYTYNTTLSKGDCGALQFSIDPSNGSPLVGIHVAGSSTTSYGIASKITKEFIDKYLILAASSNPPSVVFDPLGGSVPLGPTEEVMPNMIPRGYILSKTPHQPTSSKLRRSSIYGLVDEVKRAPSRLSDFVVDGHVLRPMEIAIKRYCKPDEFIPLEELECAANSLLDFLENKSKVNVPREVFSFDVAVLGDDSGHFTSLSRSKSAGYPYNVMRGDTSKSRFFGNGPVFDMRNPECCELRVLVQSIIDKARVGVRTNHYYTDHLKDERRSLAKVSAGETRLISAGPTPLLICFRMYFGAFTKWLIANRVVNGMAIGINEYSSEWDLAAHMLLQFGKGNSNIGAGDYKGFDMAHKNSVAWTILQLINDWYSDENGLIREVFWMEIVNSYHINGGSLYEWTTPLPSGAPPTSTFNCLANHLYFRLCFHRLVPEGHFDFNEDVYLLVLGDDNVFSVNPEIKHFFNEVAMQPVMLSLGQVYTPEDKSSSFSASMRDIQSVTFLKRSFRIHESTGTYMAPLELDSIIDMMNWVKKGSNSIGDCESNINTALEELTLHGTAIFNTWKCKITQAISTVSDISQPKCTNFSTLFDRIKNRDQGSSNPINTSLDYDAIEYKNLGCGNTQIDHGRLSSGLGGLEPYSQDA